MIELTQDEQKVFEAWKDTGTGYGYNFRHASMRSGVDSRDIRDTVRSLANKGLLAFCRNGWTDTGEMYGACYTLTEAGRSLLNQEKEGQ